MGGQGGGCEANGAGALDSPPYEGGEKEEVSNCAGADPPVVPPSQGRTNRWLPV